MIKLLVCSDFHLRDDNSENRIDDMYEVQFTKVQQVLDIFYAQKCEYILHAGDMFDYWKSSYKLTNRLLGMLPDYKILLAIGNHDVQAYSLDTLPYTSLGSLIASNKCILKDHSKLPITFIDTRLNFNIADYTTNKNPIIVSHDMISPTQLLKADGTKLFEHTYYKELDGCADVIISGHLHRQFIIQGEKTLFINPGPLLRTSVTDTFEPHVVILTYDNDQLIGKPKYEVIPLKVKPYKEVFKKDDKKAERIEIPKFDIDTIEEQDLVSKLRKYGNENSYDPEIVREAITRVESVQDTISSGD